MDADLSPVTLSLFSGAGGLDIGFHNAGFNIVACVEKEETFCKTLETNSDRYLSPGCRILNRDIRSVEPDNIGIAHIDFIIGGPPCQSFSAIGRRAGGIDGIDDIRGSLFEDYCRLVNYYHPLGFLFENVRGILGSNKGRDWLRIVQAFSALGYQLAYRVLDAADYGVPQHRERLILVGTRTTAFRFPMPSHGPDSRNKTPYISASVAISDLQNPTEPTHTYSGKYGELLSEVPPGQNYHYFTQEMGHPAPKFAWRSRFSDFLYKADPDQPVRTIVAQSGKYSGPFHWKNRKFTFDEFKRLQTFPDDYEFAGGMTKALQQLGNSVPPTLGLKLALAVRQELFNAELDVDLIDDSYNPSYDSRKAKKAKKTRTQRSKETSYPLLDWAEGRGLEDKLNDPVDRQTTFCSYSSLKHRQLLPMFLPSANSANQIYSVAINRQGSRCAIEVKRYDEPDFACEPLIRYTLSFPKVIGNGLSSIECTLFSREGEDIPVAWDAIEDYLSSISGYQTMFDIYGHFTEPHPKFSLRMDVLNDNPSFIVRFAKQFSAFEETAKILPASVLRDLYIESNGKSILEFNLSKIARSLRDLRFDVRVRETNRAIPQGYFRCCYPFTMSTKKQVSVTWKEF